MLGVYVSVPFCRAKCSFCNFASGVFAAERMHGYVEQVCAEMREAREYAERLGAACRGAWIRFTWGVGRLRCWTPALIRQMFGALRGSFRVDAGAEITVECAPGQVEGETLAGDAAAGSEPA